MRKSKRQQRQLRRLVRNLGLEDADDTLGELALAVGASDLQDLETRIRGAVESEVRGILASTEVLDAFDVIELMRQRELPLVPALALRPGYDGSAAAIELIALVLLTRAGRHPSDTPREDTRPNEVIAELHSRALRLMRLAVFRSKTFEALHRGDPVARLSAEYQAHAVGVRALQYDGIQNEHESALFSRPDLQKILTRRLGFSYADFQAVRTCVQSLTDSRFTAARDLTGDAVLALKAEDREPTGSEAEILRQALADLFFLPAERAAFTADDLAEHTDLDVEVIHRVLAAFSIGFDPGLDPVDAVVGFLRGRNPFTSRGLVREGAQHVLVSGPIDSDAFRAAAERALKNTPDWDRYDTIRGEVSESLAVRALTRSLATAPLATNLEYFAPNEGQGAECLSRMCPDATSVGKQTEADALFVIDDVAICLEVKGRLIAEQARRGDLARLRTEIKNTMGSGALQAQRLACLISENGGVWTSAGSWLDLSQVRETRTIVASLDTFGPLSVALGDLVRADLVQKPLPWMTSIHDVDVISRVVDRPAEFLLYLRRRTESGVAEAYRGSDELDLFMLFLGGGLYVEDDPDEIHGRYPRTSVPSNAARKRRAADATPTMVGTFTDPLDAWMYHVDGTSPFEAEKPSFTCDPQMAQLVDFISREHKPGWLRTGADLLSINGSAQRKLTRELKNLSTKTARDAKPHTLSQGFASSSGFSVFFARSVPQGCDEAVEERRLYEHMLAKKHQVGADRSFGMLVDERGRVLLTAYTNDPPQVDADLDALGERLGLQRTWEQRRNPSPRSEQKRKRRRRRR